MDHILKFILKMQRERYKAVVVKEHCVNNLMAFAGKHNYVPRPCIVADFRCRSLLEANGSSTRVQLMVQGRQERRQDQSYLVSPLLVPFFNVILLSLLVGVGQVFISWKRC